MKFFNIDCHISVIADMQHIFKSLGHEIVKSTLSGHYWVMNEKRCEYDHFGWDLSEANLERFYQKYKNAFDDYDGFIICYPISFYRFWLKFNKPIIANICVRYEIPYTQGKEDWKNFDRLLIEESKRTPKRLWIVANNKGDQGYLEHYTGIKCKWIPGLCEYINIKYDPSKTIDAWAVFSRNKNFTPMLPNTTIMPWGYKWEELYQRKGVIHLPYHNTTMSLVEHYTANMPIFVPSKQLMRQWAWPHEMGMFCEINFFRVAHASDPKVNEPKDGSLCDATDPKVYDWWLDQSDFYDDENMPHTIKFNSREHLHELQLSTNYREVSENMRRHNIGKRMMVYNAWSEILAEISASRSR